MTSRFLTEFQALFQEGGWVFGGLLVLAFSIAFSLLSIRRLLLFRHAPQPARSSWVQLLQRTDLDEPELQTVAGFFTRDGQAEELELELFGKLRRRFSFTFTLISAAPLLGLLGTVSGMFATFHGLSLSATQAPVDVISGGISEALITTQTGLVIGVPAFIACSLLKSRARSMELAFERLKARVPTHGGSEPANSPRATVPSLAA